MMRNFKRLFALLISIVALMFAACERGEEPGGQINPTPEAVSFEVSIDEVSKSRMSFTVTPSVEDVAYLVFVMDRESADEYLKDEYLVATIYQDITEEAASLGLTFEEYMADICDMGKVEGSFSGLVVDTEYYLLVFAVDAARGYEAASAVVKTPFTTLSVPISDCGFSVDTKVVNNSVTFDVVPDDESISWHLFSVTKSLYDQYTDPNSEVGWSKEYFFSIYFQEEINGLLSQGYSQQDVIDALIFSGSLSLEAKGLNANTDYVYLVAGLSLDEDGLYITTDAVYGEFRTEDAPKSDMTFDIKVWDIEPMAASFSITPSKNDEIYCALVAPWDGVSDANEMMHSIVEQWGSLMSLMANDKGPVEHSGANKFKLPAADTSYYIIAFGYDGGITTNAEMVTFRTLEGGNHEDVEFGITSSSISPYGFTMNITSSDPTIYYVVGIAERDEYVEEEFIAMENEVFDYYYAGSKDFNPSITAVEVLDQYYYNGSNTIQVSGVMPDSEFMAYIYTLDNATGHVVRSFTFDSVATTGSLGSVTPTIELVGYYSGDEEAGTIFKDAAATRGKAITVVSYDNLDGARSLFTTMLQDDCTNPTSYPDAELWGIATGYWRNCKVAIPYTFYTAEWEHVQTALAYAVDMSGAPGNIARMYTCATADAKSPIDELRELYDRVLAADKAQAIPASVVVGERSARPRLTALGGVADEAVVVGNTGCEPCDVGRITTTATHLTRYILRD